MRPQTPKPTASGGHALNCIIDDSALIAGLKDYATANLRQWIRESVVNVFVPLYSKYSFAY